MLRARGFLSAGRFFLLISSAFLVAFGILFSFYYEEGRSLLSLAIAPVPRQAFLPHQLFSSTAALPFVLSDTGKRGQSAADGTRPDRSCCKSWQNLRSACIPIPDYYLCYLRWP